MMSNAAFSTEQSFKDACELAGIKPTAAQASKYRRGFGAAYNAEKGRDPSSEIDARERPEVLDCQRTGGRTIFQEYGPYAPSKQMANTMPKPKRK